MTCTKSCARQAIQTRIQYQLAFYPGKLIPLVGPRSVTWTLVDCHGNVERFIMRTLAGEEDDEI
jgi:adenylylsulfate reductase subunit B